MEGKCKQWREKNRLTAEERRAFINHINGNMRNFEENIQYKMQRADKIELKNMSDMSAKTEEEIEYMMELF